MSPVDSLYNQIIENMGVPGLSIPLSAVKFYRGKETPPDIMKDQSKSKKGFAAPSPKDFTDGIVYACKAANKPDFALF